MKKNANRNLKYIYGIADLPHTCGIAGKDADMADGPRIYC